MSFNLYPGEVLGIVGESGSGKSTVVRLLHFDFEPTEGEFRLSLSGNGDGASAFETDSAQNLFALSSFRRRQVRNELMGIVYQNARMGLRMKVSAGGNIAERLLMARWRHVGRMRQRAAELLAQTEVPVQRMNELPRNFSGGMQQRVQIAKALSTQPALLLLDEVTTGSGRLGAGAGAGPHPLPAAGAGGCDHRGLPRPRGHPPADVAHHRHATRMHCRGGAFRPDPGGSPARLHPAAGEFGFVMWEVFGFLGVWVFWKNHRTTPS